VSGSQAARPTEERVVGPLPHGTVPAAMSKGGTGTATIEPAAGRVGHGRERLGSELQAFRGRTRCVLDGIA
jgi:hypothetical protein